MSAEQSEVEQPPTREPTAVENVTSVVAKFDRVAAGLGELKTKYQGVLFEVTTPKGMRAAIEARAAIRDPRFEVERVRKECKAPILALGRDIDARAAKITEELLALETPIDKHIKAEETRREEEKKRKQEAEAARVRAIQGRLNHIRAYLLTYARQPASSIEEGIRSLIEIPVDGTFQECEQEASALHAQVLGKLREMHTAQIAHETEQERLRLEREELDRQALAQQEANRLERERIAAEEAEAKRKRDAEDAERKRQQQAQEVERQQRIDEAMAKMRAEREALKHEQAKLEADKAELARQQAELAKPAPAPIEANARLADDFVVTYDVVEIPAAGDVYQPAELPHIEARAYVWDEHAEQMLEEQQHRLGLAVIFTRCELAALAASPEALQALIDYHDNQFAMADATGAIECAEYSGKRLDELHALHAAAAAKRQKEIDG